MVKPYPLSRADDPAGTALTQALSASRWRDTFRVLFRREPHECRPDWPRKVCAETLARWLRPSDVLVELSPLPAREPLTLAIALHAESATRMVEWLLGAPESASMASRCGEPSEAECGVLAYAAARLCAAVSRDWQVRDVRSARDDRLLAHAVQVLWPITLRFGEAPISASLLLSRACAAHTCARERVEVLVRDVPEPGLVDALAPGQVLVSDRWTLTPTSTGAAGDVWLSVSGIDTQLAAQLDGDRVVARAPASADEPEQLALVISHCAIDMPALAALAEGTPTPIMPVGQEPARLRLGARELARGELIVHRGALGIRIGELVQDVSARER